MSAMGLGLLLATALGLLFPVHQDAAQELTGPELVKKFTHYFIDAPNQEERVFRPTFLGIPLMQNPADMWVMQEIISELKPDFIIETGTFAGGSALYFATILANVNPAGKVITIDIAPRTEAARNALPPGSPMRAAVDRTFRDHIQVIASDSADPKLVARLAAMTKGKTVLVTLDSCHGSQHVLKEMELYSKLVSLGSYLIVQDTFIDEKPEWIAKWARCPGYELEGGPGLALERFLEGRSDFSADRSREKYLLTFYPSGYLKRVERPASVPERSE